MVVATYSLGIVRTPKKLIDRNPESLTANVPERLINAGDGRAYDRTRPVKAVNVHGLPVMLHLHGILANHEFTEVLNARHGSLSFALECAFSPADNALIGLELYEHVG